MFQFNAFWTERKQHVFQYNETGPAVFDGDSIGESAGDTDSSDADVGDGLVDDGGGSNDDSDNEKTSKLGWELNTNFEGYNTKE